MFIGIASMASLRRSLTSAWLSPLACTEVDEQISSRRQPSAWHMASMDLAMSIL